MDTNRITRREALQVAASGVLAAGSSGALARGAWASSAPSRTTALPRRGGTIRAGLTGGGGTDTLDPQNALGPPDFARAALMFDPMVGMTTGGQPTLLLAEDISSNSDATEWTIKVRQGVEFHNGKELTSDDVVYSFKRMLDPQKPTQDTLCLSLVNEAQISKVDKYTTRFPCHSSFATFVETLSGIGAGLTFAIVPVDFNPKKPIGTGPFKYVSFVPNDITVVTRNPHYWQTGKPYADGVVLTEYGDETSQINAFVSGQEDVVDSLDADSIAQITAAGRHVLVSDAGGWNPFVMQVDKAPFNDVRVRQAFRLALDRPQFLKLVFGGRGTIGNDVFSLFDPDYDHALPQRAQDVEQAKSLLRQAGHADLSVQFVSSDIGQGTTLSAQVMAQQLAAVGVKVSIQQVTGTAFFGSQYLKRPFTIGGPWAYDPYLMNVAQATLTTSAFNETAFNDPHYNRLYQQGVATLDLALRKEIIHEMQTIDYATGGYMIPFFPPIIDGYAANVHGLLATLSGLPLNNYNFADLWVS